MSSGKFLEKMMESMIMEMLNKQRRGSSPSPCSNRNSMGKSGEKTRKRKKHRHCKKKRSKCPTDVASIICVRKCLSKGKKTEERKGTDPCCPKRKSKNARITICCSSDSCASDPKYCSKCGQPLPGSNGVAQKNSQNVRETQSKITAKGMASPEETCISCHTRTTCTPCHDSITPVRSHQNIVGQCAPECNFFGAPYFFGNLTNSKPECSRFTCNENKPVDIRIKTCGKNIIPVICDGEFNAGKNRGKGAVNCGNERGDLEETKCSQRFIHITKDKKSRGSCITKVRCADFSSVTSGPCANSAGVPSVSSVRTPGNTGIAYSPCSDRRPPAVESNPASCHSSTPHVVRIRLANLCQPAIKSDGPCKIHTEDYESDCDKQPCTCCAKNTSRPVLPFCYDPGKDEYEDEFGDSPCNCTDEPDPTRSQYPHSWHPSPQPPPPVYNDPYEYLPPRSTTYSESSSDNSTQESLPPKGRYGYDFFYGSVKCAR